MKLGQLVATTTLRLLLFAPLLTFISCTVLTAKPAPPDLLPKTEWRVELPQQDSLAIMSLLRTGQFTELDRQYEFLQERYEEGKASDQDLVLQYQAFYDTSPENETYLNQWVTKSPQSYPARLARGIYYLKTGEDKRGEGWAKDIPKERMIELSQYLDLSNTDVVASLSLTPKPIVSLVTLIKSSMYRDGNRTNRMWLDYANRIAPQNYSARRRYMISIEPRWGGSYEEMWRFLKECQEQNLPNQYLQILESRIYIDQADMLRHAKQKEKAFPLYKKALVLLDGIDTLDRLTTLKELIHTGYRASANNLEEFSHEIDETLRLSPTESQILGYRGWIRFKQGRVQEGMKDYSLAAELGDAYAQFQVGQKHYYGAPPFLAPNQEHGLGWIRKSARQEYEAAKRFLMQLGQGQ